MKNYQVDLFDFFDDQTKKRLKAFCDRINRSDADVFLIMAHKAVLLFHLLLAQGYISQQVTKKIIITNFSLDFNSQSLQEKKIAILDDIVISGTSISSTVSKLLSFNIPQDNIDVIVVAIDKDYFAMDFTNTKGVNVLNCNDMIDDASCIELSATISKVFSYYGLPYDVDFPMYEEFPIRAEELNILHNNLFWDIVDVTNANQKAGGVTVYVIRPTPSIRNRLWGTLRADLENCVDVKIRLYVTLYPDGSLECSIVPMCLFKEISVDALCELYQRMKPSNLTDPLWSSLSSVAQMRYLEFFIAHQFCMTFSKITSLGCGIKLQESTVNQLFGPDDGMIISNFLKSNPSYTSSFPLLQIEQAQMNYSSIISEYKESDVFKNALEESTNWTKGNSYEQGCWINQFIYTAFMWWYDDKEINVRNDLRENPLHYVKDEKVIFKYLFRLQNGLSMKALQQILKIWIPDLSDNEAENTISIFIDRGVDEGIIVPTIYYSQEEKYLCRVYRHGEDLPFGASDKYRLVYFLKELGSKIYNSIDWEGKLVPSVGSISLEKMIVSFYQMGLKQGNIFNRFLGFDNCDIIHSFLSVHGAVLGYTDYNVTPRICSEKDSKGIRYITWLTTWLSDAGLVGSSPADPEEEELVPINLSAIEEYLANNQRSTLSESIRENIASLAELIADWYIAMVNGDRRAEFKDNIIALTSCANRFVFASAIATENHYFFNYWNHQVAHAFEGACNSQRLVERLTDSEENQKYTKIIIQGLHSGRKKVGWRNENRAQTVIEEVKTYLDSSTKSTVWAKLWSGVDTMLAYRVDELEGHINKAKSFLFFFSACFECLKSVEFWNNGTLPPDFSEYERNYLSLTNKTQAIDSSLFNALKNIAKLDGHLLEGKITEFRQIVQEVLFRSECCMDKIEEIVKDCDPTYTVAYKSALILDVNALDSETIKNAFEEFWNQMEEDEGKTELNIISFPKKLSSAPYLRYGIFFCPNKAMQPLDKETTPAGENTALKCGVFLYNAFQNLCSLLNAKVFQIRGVLLPHIIPDLEFKHNLRQNIAKNAEEFNERIKPFESYYDGNCLTQLIVGMDRQVNSQFCKCFSSWNTSPVNKIIPGAEWINNCMVCKKAHIVLDEESTDLMNRVAYSQLKVCCGGTSGLGVLLRISNQVVCVSCNHTFKDYSENSSAQATSAYSPDYTFDLSPLTTIHQYPNNNDLQAKDEVLVLEPHWNGDIPFEISKLLSLEDFAGSPTQAKCSCYGCNDSGQMKWVNGLYVVGPIEKGYYQVGGEISKIHSGFSGGVYIGNSTQSDIKIFGIHEGRFGVKDDREAVMIPSLSIKAALSEAAERRCITDGRARSEN